MTLRNLFSIAAACAALTLGLQAQQSAKPAPKTATAKPTADPHRALVDRYCVTCHNQRAKTANLMFDTMDLAKVGEDAVIWERAARKLKAGMMPPPGARQPAPAELKSFVGWLETSLDSAAAKNPNPGRVALHRLNRTEYANAVKDILGVEADPSTLLPVDDISDGFDNIANVLKVSPSFIDQYIGAARQVTAMAIGTKTDKPVTASLRGAAADQSQYVEGLPLGTRGGFVTSHLFPADGEYEFTIPGLAGAGYAQGMEYKHRVILTIDGEKVFDKEVGGEDDLKFIDQKQAPAVAEVGGRFRKIRIPLEAGVHKVGAAFVARGMAESDDLLQSFTPGAGINRIPRISGLDVVGPYNPANRIEAASHAKIFICKPPDPREEQACANRIFTNIAKKAFRRPVTDKDVASAMAFFKDGRTRGDFDAGVQNGLVAILSSPKFLYRAEAVPANVKPGQLYRINDLELASRLSFFLWSQSPDDTLIDLAAEGKLSNPLVLDAQVKRMLADPRAKALVSNFAFQWLNMGRISEIDPDPVQFPGFDRTLRTALITELQMFLESIIKEDRPATEMLTGNYTFVNERLAKHYDIPNIRGSQFRRITLADTNRWGLLGKGAVLMVTSYPNRTAPVLRGAWILERILGTPPSPPPPNVEAFPENKEGAKVLSVRQRMEEHRKNPSCNACHGIMDPLGFALENYDAVGEWRTMDRWAGVPIDSSGKLVDGTPVSGPADLRIALAAKQDQFVRTLAEKLTMYALGRQVEATDMPVIRRMVGSVAKNNYRFSSLVTAIVKSEPFQMKRADTPADALAENIKK
jgi:mono/diheme cytochrome c family protein